MNARLNHAIDFTAIVIDDEQLFPVQYELKIDMITTTEDSQHHNVAIQRILFFIDNVLNNNLFINVNNSNYGKIKKLFPNNNIVEFPEVPYEQLITMILFHKLSAITEGVFEIDQLTLGSTMTPGLSYIIDDFINIDPDINITHWWDSANLSISDKPKHSMTKVTWDEINLDWEQKKNNELEFLIDLEDNPEDQPEITILDGGKNINSEENEDQK